MKRFAQIACFSALVCIYFVGLALLPLPAQIPLSGSGSGLPSGLTWASGVLQARDAAVGVAIRANGVGASASAFSWYFGDTPRAAITYDSNNDTLLLSAHSLGLPLTVVTFSATPTFAAAAANNFKITLTDNVTSSTLSGAATGEYLSFLICQDATGSRTFVWPTNVKGGGTIGATLSTCSAQSFLFDGTNAYAQSAIVTGM